MAKRPSRGWTLLVLAEDNANHRQFRVSRGLVFSLISVVAIILLVAIGEGVFLWNTQQRAAQVEPLKQRIVELEEAEAQVVQLGQELTDLQSFSAQLRRMLTASGSDSGIEIPWPRSEPSSLASQIDAGDEFEGDEPVAAVWHQPLERVTDAASLPTYPPVRGYITRKFLTPGPFRFASHEGLDIAAREGTPILAAASGIVLFAGWTYPYGKLIVIAHPSGYTTFYGHNQTCLVDAGESVLQGQPIGLLGNSGRSTAPHLHFEIWQGERAIDPLAMLQPDRDDSNSPVRH